VEIKFILEYGMKAQGGINMEPYSFFNLGSRRSGWSAPSPGRFVLKKETSYSFCRRLGGPEGWLGHLWQIRLLLGFDPQTVQPVASLYTGSCYPGPLRVDTVLFPEISYASLKQKSLFRA